MPNAWIFQGKPEIWDVPAGVTQLKRINWGVRQYKNEINAGDRVYIWVSGRNAGIVALATITSRPEYLADTPEELELYPSGPPRKFQGKQLRVFLNVDRVLKRRITRSELLTHPTLKNLSILAMPQGTNFKVSPGQAHELMLIANGR